MSSSCESFTESSDSEVEVGVFNKEREKKNSCGINKQNVSVNFL